MAIRTDAEDVGYLIDSLHQAPDGTWEQDPDGTYRFRWGRRTVRLREKQRGVWEAQREGPIYEVRLKECECSCPHHFHRLTPGQRCGHLDALFALLPRIGLTLCPGCEDREHCRRCGGRGVLDASVRVEEEMSQEQLMILFR